MDDWGIIGLPATGGMDSIRHTTRRVEWPAVLAEYESRRENTNKNASRKPSSGVVFLSGKTLPGAGFLANSSIHTLFPDFIRIGGAA